MLDLGDAASANHTDPDGLHAETPTSALHAMEASASWFHAKNQMA